MLDNPNTNVQDNTITTTHNTGDEQYIYLLSLLDNPNTNAHNDCDEKNTYLLPLLIIPIKMPRTIQTPQYTMIVMNNIFTCSICLIIPIQCPGQYNHHNRQ
jgi:hypothetical protein